MFVFTLEYAEEQRGSNVSLVNEKIRLKMVRDLRQITFVTLNRYCLLSKKEPTPVYNGEYPAGWNTKQN